MRIVECSFYSNSTNGIGGGVFQSATSFTTFAVKNSIFWGNFDQSGVTKGAQLTADTATTTVNYSCVQGWSEVLSGTGNFGLDPLFVDADGADNLGGTIDDDLRLGPGSPCIDAADNDSVPDGLVLDVLGLPRFVDDPNVPDTGVGTPPIVDMGAHERQP